MVFRVSCVVAGVSLVCLLGCATVPRGGTWGADATLLPGWKRVGEAARTAAFEPRTWVPLAGALLTQIGDTDSRIADWAGDNTPLWGSPERAGRGSDDLLAASQVAYAVTVLLTPSGTDGTRWVVAKAKGVGVGMLAVGLNHGTTELLKSATQRVRPDRSDNRSLPSGHASQASVCASLAGRNCRWLPLDRRMRIGLEASFSALAVGCAWSRVEARKHYLSDALTGFALGHFCAAFVTDAFLGAGGPQNIGLRFDSSGSHVILRVDVRFE